MPNTIAMDKAITSFYHFLGDELLDYFAKNRTSTTEHLSEFIEKLEKRFLLPSLKEAAVPGYYKSDDDDEPIGWRDLAKRYQTGMENILKALLEKATQQQDFGFHLRDVLSFIQYQQEFRHLRPILEVVRNPESLPKFNKDASQSGKAELFQEVKTTIYYPILDKDLSPYYLAWPKHCSNQAIAALTYNEKMTLIELLLQDHVNRVKNYDLLLQVTELLVKDPNISVTRKILTDWIRACGRQDGELANYSYATSLLRWLSILEHHFPNFEIDIYLPCEFIGYFIHELELWPDAENSRVFNLLNQVENGRVDKVTDDQRINILLDFLQRSSATYQKRVSKSVNQLMLSAQVHPELPYVSERLAKNASKLFRLLNEYRPIAFTPHLAARFLNTWCQFGLHEDTDGVIDYLLDQHAGYLNETYVQFVNPMHERQFIQFLNSLERGGPYALIFFRKYPKLLMKPSLTEAVLYSNVICKNLRKEYENKAVKNPVLKTLVLALTSLDADELLTILSRPKEPNEDYQATLQIILGMGQVEQKIANNKLLTLHCITKNYLETLSLSLIQIAPLTIPDIIHLLTTIATPSLARALIRRAQLLQSQAPKKNPIVLSHEAKLALHHMLQARQGMVDRKDRCVGFEDDIIPCFARFLIEKGTMQLLLECDDQLTYLRRNQKLLDAIIDCADTCDAYLQVLRNPRTVSNYELMRMMNEMTPESFAQLVYRDEKLLERIKKDPELSKRAVACNFNEKLSLLILPYLKYPADKLCELLKETKSEKVRLELLKKFIPVRLQAPIALLNDTLRALKLTELSNAVVDRYQDYDHINALLQSAQSQELSLLAHLVANKQWLQTILNNIRLTDLANWIRKSSGEGPWEYCLRHIVIPKMHLLLQNDKANVLAIQVELLNMMEYFKSNLAFSTLIYSDEKLRGCITIDILKLTLQSAFLDCTANAALEFKLHLLSDLLKLDQINIRHWVELLNDKTIGDQTLQERLLDCALCITPPFAFGKTLMNFECLQTVCKEIEPERILIVLRYLLKKLVELNAQFQLKNGLGSLQGGVDRGMGSRNILMIETQVLELLTAGIVQEWLLNQQLPGEELSILLQLATRKEVLNDSLLLTALRAPNWTFNKFAVFANSVTTKYLHELLERNHHSINDDDDGDDEEFGSTYIAKVRLFFTEIIQLDCMIVGPRDNEAREHMLQFICCTDLQRDMIFQMNKEESGNWISTIVALLLRQKPASTQELVTMMERNPEMLPYQYLLLKPSIDAFDRKYYLSLLKCNPAQAIQADIIQEVVFKAKTQNKISDLIQLFNTAQDDDLDIMDMPGIIARAKWAYDQSRLNLFKEHQLSRVKKDKFLQLTLLVASLNNEMEYGIGYKAKPRDCYHLDDFVYTDARWLNPLIEIDGLIRSVHHTLIHEGWLIDPDNPYKGIAPNFETAVVGPLKLNSKVLPGIKLLALESIRNEEEEIVLNMHAPQMQL